MKRKLGQTRNCLFTSNEFHKNEREVQALLLIMIPTHLIFHLHQDSPNTVGFSFIIKNEDENISHTVNKSIG